MQYKYLIGLIIISLPPLARAESRLGKKDERQVAYRSRVEAALAQTIRRTDTNMESTNNGDETNVADYAAQFTKLLDHDTVTGIPSTTGQANYEQLVKAMDTGKQDDFNAILFAGANTRKFMNPQAGLAFSMEGCDSSLLTMPNPPTLTSAQQAADILEVYLQQVCRDVKFSDYGTGTGTDDDGMGGSITNKAALVLDDLGTAYKGPKNSGTVDSTVLFRGISTGDKVGPYLSQFLLQNLMPMFVAGCAGPIATLSGIPNLPLSIFASKQTKPIAAKREFGVAWADYVAIQNGEFPKQYSVHDYDDTNVRYPITGRDLGSYVHFDGPFEAYYVALNILATRAFPTQPTFPYRNGAITKEYAGFTMSVPDAFSLVGGVFVEAFKAAWAQKWRSHRRLRPEVMAGLIHQVQTTLMNPYNLHSSIFSPHAGVDVLALVLQKNEEQASLPFDSIPLIDAQTYLLGQMYPEASPAHPAYPSGHATVAGACTTVIKAIFDDTAKIKDFMTPVKPDPADATALVALSGEGENTMTVGSELDKLASNIAMARDFAGVHYRSDGDEGILLGEKVAIAYLQDHCRIYNEQGFTGFELTKRDGTRIRITKDGVANI